MSGWVRSKPSRLLKSQKLERRPTTQEREREDDMAKVMVDVIRRDWSIYHLELIRQALGTQKWRIRYTLPFLKTFNLIVGSLGVLPTGPSAFNRGKRFLLVSGKSRLALVKAGRKNGLECKHI